MGDKRTFKRIDPERMEADRKAEHSSLRMRWWLILPLAVGLCVAQSFLCLKFEFGPTTTVLVATQISVIAFAFLFALTLIVNPLLRLKGWALNRGEIMTIVAALFVSAGISSFGLVDQLIPIIAAPFDPQHNTEQSEWEKHIIPHLPKELYITDTEAIHHYRLGYPDRESVWKVIPWMLWLKPLALWMIFVLGMYALFYGLSMLLYDPWARREKLIFPLARLPEAALHDEGAQPGTISSTFRSKLFWMAFLGVFALLSYNAACQAEWFRALQPIRLGIDQNRLFVMLSETFLSGLADYSPSGHRLMFLISFVGVGIAFLLPLHISSSVWGYHLIAMGLFWVAIRLAVAGSVRGFAGDWLWINHFVSSLGGGALLAFAAAVLVKMALDRAARVGAENKGVKWPERAWRVVRSFGWGGVVFGLSFAVVWGWLRWCGVPLNWALIFLALCVLVTVALMRVVAEGGVFWFQVHTGPFYVAKAVGGASVVPGGVIAALLPIYWIFFVDPKTFMAPAVVNGFKMQEESRASRRWFHVIVIASVLATVITATVTILVMVYKVGANNASVWFFNMGPPMVLDGARDLITGARGQAIGKSNWIFYLIGAAWVILSLVMRRRFFWWLHPIGLVMVANPLMTQLWFGFFIGWLCKKLTVKYGGRHTFALLRPGFIGLIFGQLFAAFFWAVLAAMLELPKVNIHINNYNP